MVNAGTSAGRFGVGSARLASYAILDLGLGVAVWFREDGELTEDTVVGSTASSRSGSSV
ncbi:hypothetical protein GCM10010199_18110 [Dactylosporangium roseum]